ncbi:myb-like protein D [Solenopsis invicta]|uniref:myb-like protein D n=1 Tax=Solenopsis invicta TaxID=13686 RepID=UPI00193E5B53|nr:myb-like protein D [Solenopsis invicta]
MFPKRSRVARLFQNDNAFDHLAAPEHIEIDANAVENQDEQNTHYSNSELDNTNDYDAEQNTHYGNSELDNTNDYDAEQNTHYSNSELDNTDDYDAVQENTGDEHNCDASESNENENNSSLEDINNENNMEVDEALELNLDNRHIIQQPQMEVRDPLYEDCPLTREESELLILEFSIRHHITDATLEDIIQVIDCPSTSSTYIEISYIKSSLGVYRKWHDLLLLSKL